MAGADRIEGEDENDLLYGDRGRDVLVGDAGGDRLVGGSGDDHLYGGDGADNLLGREGDDYISEGPGHSSVEGGEGNDTLVGGEGPDAFIVDRASGDDVVKDFTAGPGMFDHIAMRDLRWEDLTVQDTERGALVSWEGGSVLLEDVARSQLAQDDFMFADMPDLPPGERAPGGPMEERALTDEGPEFKNDKLPGRDFDKAADKILADSGVSFDFRGDNTYQAVVGTPENDNQHGSAAWDHFFGRDGDDRFIGIDGDDVLNGDAGDDRLGGGRGSDRLDGGVGDDLLVGGDEADELMGMDGNDRLNEGAGHGMLEGGVGDDLITGGTGADAFIVAPDSGNDIVTDFEALVGINGGDAQSAFDHIALRDILPEQVKVSSEPVTRSFDGESFTGVLVSWNMERDDELDGSILLAGLTKPDLRQSDFMFVEEPGFVESINDFGSWYIFSDHMG